MNKKILLLLLAILAMAVPSSWAYASTMYAMGDIAGVGGWNPTKGKQMTRESDGVYTLNDINITGYFGFSEVLANNNDDGGWSWVNGYRYGPSSKDYGVGTGTHTVSKSTNSWEFTGDKSKKYDVKLDLTKNQLTISEHSSAPTISTLYLRGSFNGFGTSNDWKFSTTDGVTYTLTGKDISAGDEMKVADASSNFAEQYTSGGDIEPNKEYTLATSGDNMKLITGVKDATITFNKSTKVFKISGTEVAVERTYWLKGSGTGFSWENGLTFNKISENNYSVHFSINGNNEFKIDSSHNGWWNGKYNGSYSNFPSNQTIILSDVGNTDGSNMKFASAFTGTISIQTNSSGAITSIILTPDAEFVETPVGPLHLYMSTNVSGNSSKLQDWQHGFELARVSNGKFAGLVTAKNTSVSNLVYFFNTKYNEWPSPRTKNGYGVSGSNNQTVTSGTQYALTPGGASYYQLPSTGTYLVEVEFTDNNTAKVKFTKDNTGDQFVYFNIGSDYYNQPKWRNSDGTYKTPYAIFGSNTTGEPMYRIDADLPLFRAKVPYGATQLKYVSSKNSNNPGTEEMRYELSQATSGDDNAGYQSSYWNKFIFGADNGVFFQSYLTYDMLLEQRKNKDKKLCLIGFTGSWTPSVSGGYKYLDPSEGVYITQLSGMGQTDGYYKFKMGYIDPVTVINEINTDKKYSDISSVTVTNKRSWMTFNLGLIGPSMNYYTTAGAPIYFPVINPDKDNKGIQIGLRETSEFNHWNQYDWVMASIGATNYLVVDLDYGTMCVLPFNPQPTARVTTKKGETEIHDLDASHIDRDNIEDVVVNGSDDSGANVAHFRYVNAVPASATISNNITSSEASNFNSNFTADYELTFEGESLGTTPLAPNSSTTASVKTVAIDQDGSDLSSDLLTARIFYTAKTHCNSDKEGLRFRSNTTPATLNNEVSVPKTKPSAEVKFFEVVQLDGEIEKYSALVGIFYTLPSDFLTEETVEDANTLAIYPTFEVYVVNNKTKEKFPAVLADPDNYYIKNRKMFLNGNNSLDDKYDFPKASSEVGEGSWAYQSINATTSPRTGYLPLVAYNVTEGLGTDYNLSVEAKVFATYPFRIFTENNLDTGASAPGNSEDPSFVKRRANSNDASRIVTYDVPVAINSDPYANGSGLSGIEDAVIEVEGEGVLYNLQGVRVTDAAPAPGVYLRRNADGSASKVIIR